MTKKDRIAVCLVSLFLIVTTLRGSANLGGITAKLQAIEENPDPVCVHQTLDQEMAGINIDLRSISEQNEALKEEVAGLRESVKKLEEIQSQSYIDRLKKIMDDKFGSKSWTPSNEDQRDALNKLFDDVERSQNGGK